MIGKVDDVNPSTPRRDPSTALRTSGLGLPSTRDFDEPSRVAQAEGTPPNRSIEATHRLFLVLYEK